MLRPASWNWGIENKMQYIYMLLHLHNLGDENLIALTFDPCLLRVTQRLRGRTHRLNEPNSRSNPCPSRSTQPNECYSFERERLGISMQTAYPAVPLLGSEGVSCWLVFYQASHGFRVNLQSDLPVYSL